MARTLRGLVVLMGVACVLIGLVHLTLGVHSVAGEGTANATVDSRERFYNAIFVGYGLAWLWVARQSPIPASAVRALTGVFLLGALGRLISLIEAGSPQWFQLVLTGMELVLPPIFLWLADAEERAGLRATDVPS